MKTTKWFVIMQEDEIMQFNDPFERAIYESIKSYCGNGKTTAALSLRDIARRANTTFVTVNQWIPRLCEKKFIEIVGYETRVGGKVPVYKVLLSATVSVMHAYTLSPKSVTPLNTLPKKSVKLTQESVKLLAESVKGVASKTHNIITEEHKQKEPSVTQELTKNKEPKSSLPYKSLVLQFNRKYATNLFPTFGKQAASLKRILQSYTEEDIWKCAEWLSKDSFWAGKGFDFGTILSQIAKWKLSTTTKLEGGRRYVDAKTVDTSNF